jgi:predicted MFS family arabinose efflux permease
MLGASMIPTVFTSSFHFFPGPRHIYSAAVVGIIASIAPTLGPVIGGWITTAWVAGIALTLFVVRSLTYRTPVVDLRALGNRNFTLGCILSFISGVGIFTTIYLTPLFVSYVRGFSAYQTGMAIFSTGVATLIGTPIYILMARKIDGRWLMMFGMASFGLSMWSYSFITHEWGGAEFFLPQFLRGFPQVFAVAPAVALGLGSLPPERLKYASGLFNMMRNLGGRWDRGGRRDHQRPDQPAFREHRLAPDAGQRADDALCGFGDRALRRTGRQPG